MNMREKLARAICAKGGAGFCLNVGGSFGCKCGRGESPHWSKCVADDAQLILSGNMDTADAVLAAMRELPEVVLNQGFEQAMIESKEVAYEGPDIALLWRCLLDAATAHDGGGK